MIVTLDVLPMKMLVVDGFRTSRKFTLAFAANSCVALAVTVTWDVVNVADAAIDVIVADVTVALIAPENVTLTVFETVTDAMLLPVVLTVFVIVALTEPAAGVPCLG